MANNLNSFSLSLQITDRMVLTSKKGHVKTQGSEQNNETKDS